MSERSDILPLPSILGLTARQYEAACKAAGRSAGRVALDRYAAVFRSGDLTGPDLAFAGPSSASPSFASPSSASLAPPVVASIRRTHLSQSPEGAVLKFTQSVPRRAGDALAVLGDEVEIESVIIPMIGRRGVRTYTLCVSSQVGCAMGCTFCQTAQMGLIRSLSAAEIVGQFFAARHTVLAACRGDERAAARLTAGLPERAVMLEHARALDPAAEIGNIVFMGMGEPLDNVEQVIQAISVLTDHRGPCLPVSRITVSTVGRVDGLARLAARVAEPGWHRLGLAISVNAADDATRGTIMPINRRYPMADLRTQLERWPIFGGAHMCIEYVLIPGVNDRDDDARAISDFVLGGTSPTSPYPGPMLRAMINVIPYNPRENSPWPAPTQETVDRFMALIKARGVFVKRRRTKGRDTMAACGQLGSLAYARKKRSAAEAESPRA